MRTAKGDAPKNEQPSYEGREGGGVKSIRTSEEPQ